jgi:hypothetical protein
MLIVPLNRSDLFFFTSNIFILYLVFYFYLFIGLLLFYSNVTDFLTDTLPSLLTFCCFVLYYSFYYYYYLTNSLRFFFIFFLFIETHY